MIGVLQEFAVLRRDHQILELLRPLRDRTALPNWVSHPASNAILFPASSRRYLIRSWREVQQSLREDSAGSDRRWHNKLVHESGRFGIPGLHGPLAKDTHHANAK